jgi:hypothetical protein
MARAIRSINPILGDVSWPSTALNPTKEGQEESERVAAHLTYVHNILTASSSTDERRTRVLRHLENYIKRRVFPTNGTDLPLSVNKDAFFGTCAPRAPAFFDRLSGAPCAVAYLMQQSEGVPIPGEPNMSGAELARLVDVRHHNGYASDIYAEEPLVQEWATVVGLTATELAMIQPTYEFLNRHPYVPSPTTSPTTEEAKDPSLIAAGEGAGVPRYRFRCDFCHKDDLQPPDHFHCVVCEDTDLCMTCCFARCENVEHKVTHTLVQIKSKFELAALVKGKTLAKKK